MCRWNRSVVHCTSLLVSGLIATIGLLEKNVTEGKGALGPIGGGVPKPKPGAMPLAPISAAPVAPAGPSEKELELEAENKRIQEKLQKIQQQVPVLVPVLWLF